ncbi:ABC transporter ATP-binding protein [Halovenus marina]|uniref:ABC transporter ATP-binding protein n=1 Tax=Halovenus marina TaxID=3396621 RepID=UPI003F572F93
MPAIETRELTKYYGDVRGVEDLSFTVETGEVFGFLGPNGAGKSTTIRTLMGFQSPTEGTATVLGADIRDASALREARADVGYLPDELGFRETVTGRRLLEYHGSLRGDVRSEELLELFDPPLDRKVREYSTGNKQMLAIILAFMHDPDLVIMDEPTAGLDPLKQERLLEFIRAEQDRGKTFFFSSHILSEVRKVCDRVGIVRDGKLVELEDIDSLLDRSGKTVRVNLGGSVTESDFDIDGAHDVTVGGGKESSDGSAQPDGRDSTTSVSFTYTGAYEPLLRHLLQYDVLDLSIEEAPLEDVFMRFYGEQDARAVVEQVEHRNDSGETESEETTDV